MTDSTASVPPQGINPNALTVAALLALLSKCGIQGVTETMIQADLRDGAPTNPDGTINLLVFIAWQVKMRDGQ